jgi:SAM-dependent methyltransferase
MIARSLTNSPGKASAFAASPELHADEVLGLIVDAAALDRNGRAIDLACGPGSVACALAQRAAHVVGFTRTMLDHARRLAETRSLSNVEWKEGSIYAVPYADGWFDAVICRFAFHHLKDPPRNFQEMIRLASRGGRIVLCDGLGSGGARIHSEGVPLDAVFEQGKQAGELCGILGDEAIRRRGLPALG